jgi:peptide-methionine (S)-S-oxide reductase
MQSAVFGGGCFWCLEAVFSEVRGVSSVESGYAGGHDPAPTYEAVCRGTTGHAEVVRVDFDPAVVSYEQLVGIFFAIHDPTTKDRQGADIGTQYRSIILAQDDEQEATARRVTQALEESGALPAPIVTEVARLERFHPAEEYHRDYYRSHSDQAYCQVVISPKMAKFRSEFAHLLGG